MAQEVNLTDAVKALRDTYGESFSDNFDGGKAVMADTLKEKLKLDSKDAKAAVEALVAGHTVRYEGTALGIPSAEGSSVNAPLGFVSRGTWFLGGGDDE